MICVCAHQGTRRRLLPLLILRFESGRQHQVTHTQSPAMEYRTVVQRKSYESSKMTVRTEPRLDRANRRLGMMAYPYQVQDIPIYQVRPSRLRPLGPRDFAKIAVVSESMKAVGQLKPIFVSERLSDGSYRVVHGRHRLEAARRLGWQTIRCYVRTDPFHVPFSPGRYMLQGSW
jgi:uncharacterized ParB-like nuclease family protein